MNKLLLTLIKGLTLFYVLFGSTVFAGDKLTEVNAQVEKKAEEIDQKYGVLLTTLELNDLKIAIVAEKVTAQQDENEVQTLEVKTKAAIVDYEITDPTDQRKLLIEVEAQSQSKGTGNSSNEPPSP
jgi:predicted sulfurtransferase